MRAFALVLLAASGCSLYFGSSPGDDGPPPDGGIFEPPDGGGVKPPDAGPSGPLTARCEDGALFVTGAGTFPDSPGHGAGRSFGRCSGACRSAAVACEDAGCSNAVRVLCGAAASPGATCSLEGAACRGTQSIGCPETTTCGGSLPGSTCACTDGAYRCTQDTPAAKTQALLVGRWRGIVTPPSFAAPYQVTLWIYPDGTYWPDCANQSCSAFYYGGDGPSPDRRITVLSTSDTAGSWADIAIDFGFHPPNIGAVSGLTVDATRLRFTFFASWFGCGQPFEFNLTRY